MSLTSPLVLLVLAIGLALPLNSHAQSNSGYLAISNQSDHSSQSVSTSLLIDLSNNSTLSNVQVGVNGHEVAVSPDGHFAYVPIYGNSGVGKPGTDGGSIDVIDLREHKLAGTITLAKNVRPHCAKFGPGGYLYVSAELAKAIYIVDVTAKKVIGEIPTGAEQSHMFVFSPDGRRIYTANVGPGTVSVLDVNKRTLLKVIPVSREVQRISISPDGQRVFTHDQGSARIAVIDTKLNDVANWLNLPATVYSSAISSDGRWLAANAPSGKLFIWDLQQNKLAQTVDIPASAGEVALDTPATRVFVSCPQNGSIQIYNLATHKLAPPIQLSKGVDGLQWFPSLGN